MATKLPDGSISIDAREYMLNELIEKTPIRKSTLFKYKNAINSIEIYLLNNNRITQQGLKNILKGLKIQSNFINYMFNYGIIKKVSPEEVYSKEKHWYWELAHADEISILQCIYVYFNFKKTGEQICQYHYHNL